jgi:hypothetical protein
MKEQETEFRWVLKTVYLPPKVFFLEKTIFAAGEDFIALQ